MPHVRVLGGLTLDTLEALARADLDPHMGAALRALWTRVHDKGERERDVPVTDAHAGHEATCMLAPACDVIASGRATPYPLMLAGPHWRLLVNPWTGASKLAINAVFLQAQPLSEVAIECERIAWALWRGAARWRTSRVDIAADCVGLDMQSFARMRECIVRAKHSEVRTADGAAFAAATDARIASCGMAVQTVTHGIAASAIQACLYDKVAETRASGKAWQLDRLRAMGWDGEAPVTRVEMRFRAKAMREFPELPLASLADVLAHWGAIAPRLWAYATHDVVRYVVPTGDSNRARWPMREDWRAIASVGTVAPMRCRVVSESVREERKVRASRAFVRALVTLAAEHEDTARLACRMVRQAVDDGQLPEVALAAVVLQAQGDALGMRALGARDALERSYELRTRLMSRRAWVAWADTPATTLEAIAA